METILIVGLGYVGRCLAQRLTEKGHKVIGLKRSPLATPESFQVLVGDLRETIKSLPQRDFDRLYYLVAPRQHDQAAYEEAYVGGLQALLDYQIRVKRFFFASSTAVYHEGEGTWVDESSETRPLEFSGQTLLRAEALVSDGTIMRIGGIYGPDRRRFLDSVISGDLGENTYSNRIYREDLVSAMDFLADNPPGIYNLVDCEPETLLTISQFLRQRLGITNTRGTFRGRGNKRVSSQKLQKLGFQFAMPSYREGFEALLTLSEQR